MLIALLRCNWPNDYMIMAIYGQWHQAMKASFGASDLVNGNFESLSMEVADFNLVGPMMSATSH
jgi:hypothetical protein